LLRRELEIALGVARALDGDYELELFPGYPSSINHPKVVTMIAEESFPTGAAILAETTVRLLRRLAVEKL